MNRPDPIADRARALFDRAADGLDPAMAGRLRQARREALHGDRRRPSTRWLPAGAFAAAVLALGLAWWLPPRPAADAGDALSGTEIDELVLAEDADLYVLLADAPVAPSGARR